MMQEKTITYKSIEANDAIDRLESKLAKRPMIDCPLIHTLTEDQYIREIFMPAGLMIVSMHHLTTHPFFILEGIVSVWTEEDGEVILQAPYSGITKSGTKRVLFVHENCRWATVHKRLENETIDDIENRITEKHTNPYLTDDEKASFERIRKLGRDKVNEIIHLNH